MEWLNYHHLLYFWVVAREGSIARASEELQLAQPTISGQIHALEESLGEKLFARKGRGLALTDTGRTVYRYADEIFALGQEMVDTLKDRPAGRPVRFQVGISNAVPSLIAFRILRPLLKLPEQVRLVTHTDTPERLLGMLAVHALDLVLSDAQVGSVKVKAYNHALGESGVTFFAPPKVAARLRPKFPHSLDGVSMMLPGESCGVRRPLDSWLEAKGVRPIVSGEFASASLMNVFGRAGAGVFVAPTVIEREVQEQYEVAIVGRTDEVRERYFAISAERKVKHPAMIAITDAARKGLF